MYQGLIHKYRELLPVSETDEVVSLCEGNTPLIRAWGLEKHFPGMTIYLKYEGLNPTGSFKDRGMTLAVTKAKNGGKKAVICASTGNTSASAAAYAARAGMKAFVLIPDGKIAFGKLAQAFAYGAEVIPIHGNFDQALEWVKALSETLPVEMVNSLNPYRIEGQKTSAFEICDDLLDAPDHVFIPVGNAGNITAYWKGFTEYHALGRTTKRPAMRGFQAAGSAPLVEGRVIQNPETIATAIRIGNPASWAGAEAALSESQGSIKALSDEKILEAYALLARSEGIFAEPASCISVAGLKALYESGEVRSGTAVCILTGNGLKDPDIALKNVQIAQPAISKASIQKIIERGMG